MSYRFLDDLEILSQQGEVSDETVKFNLFVQLREMQDIARHLEKIMSLAGHQRETFIKENRPYLESLMPKLVENSNLSLEGMQLDAEAAQLSMQLAVQLRKSLSMINALFYGLEGLES